MRWLQHVLVHVHCMCCTLITNNALSLFLHPYIPLAGLSAVSSTVSLTSPPQSRPPLSPTTVKIPRGMENASTVNATTLGAHRRLSESSTSSLGSARVPQVGSLSA